jgi:peroxiredoxin Q/BCP
MPSTLSTHTRRTLLRLLCALVLGGLTMTTTAKDLAVGDPAPDFALTGSDGKVHKLADYRGKAVVLAWFPKAFTGG